MSQLMSKLKTHTAWQYLQILAGCFIGAVAYPLLLAPNHIAPGGLTGFATILHYYFGYPIGLTSLVLNLPLLYLGFRMIGLKFITRTIIATVLFTILIDLLAFDPLSLDPMLASVFGGVLLGFGMGLIIRGNATTGGTDLMARLVHQRFRGLSIGMILFAFDLFVTLLAWIFIGASHALYAIICVFITTKMVDQVILGFGTDKACYVISGKPEIIAERLMAEMDRGVTYLRASGAFSGQEQRMLVSVVGRMEVPKIKAIVREEDPNAFMFIMDTHETLGEGFRNLTGEDI